VKESDSAPILRDADWKVKGREGKSSITRRRTGEGVLCPQTEERAEVEIDQKRSGRERQMRRRKDHSLRNKGSLSEDGQEDGKVKRRPPDPMTSISTVIGDESSPEDQY
jgi:hypothetical protein